MAAFTKRFISGITSIKIGACGANGTMGTTLESIGDTVENTAAITFGAPEKTELFTEEQDSVYKTINGKRSALFEWTSYNTAFDVLAEVFGGTVTGGTTLTFPANTVTIERSVEIITIADSGYKVKIQLPRVNITASIEGNLQKKDGMKVKISADILTPYNGTTALDKMTWNVIAA